MRRFGRGGALINVRSGAIILSCTFGISLFASSSTLALAVDPLVDTVVSIAELDESGNAVGHDNGHGSNKAEGNTSKSSSANKTPDTATQQLVGDGATTAQPVIVTEPMEQLPSLDTSEAQPQTLSMYRPASTFITSPEVLGVATIDSATPLQASSHGWKVFGIAWYWWVIGSGFVYYLVRLIMRIKYRQTIRDNTTVS